MLKHETREKITSLVCNVTESEHVVSPRNAPLTRTENAPYSSALNYHYGLTFRILFHILPNLHIELENKHNLP